MGKAVTHESLSDALLNFESEGYGFGGVLEKPERARQNFLVIEECQSMSRDLFQSLHSVLDPAPDGKRIFHAKLSKEKAIPPARAGQVMPLWITGFTCILTSNYIGDVCPSTLSRFSLQHTFEVYTENEISSILTQYANQMCVQVTQEAVRFLAKRTNGEARLAVDLLSRIIDAHLADGKPGAITENEVEDFMIMEGIDDNGLNRDMVRYLTVLNGHPAGRLSQQSLESMLTADTATMISRIEPVLLRKGFVVKCSNGREITSAGREALGQNSSNKNNICFDRRIA
jgi:Holliday junction resolvasome RuvABC ATP-dependent DNA helicase subunit